MYLGKNAEAMKKMYTEHINSPARGGGGKGEWDGKGLEESLKKKKAKIVELRGLLSAAEARGDCLGSKYDSIKNLVELNESKIESGFKKDFYELIQSEYDVRNISSS